MIPLFSSASPNSMNFSSKTCSMSIHLSSCPSPLLSELSALPWAIEGNNSPLTALPVSKSGFLAVHFPHSCHNRAASNDSPVISTSVLYSKLSSGILFAFSIKSLTCFRMFSVIKHRLTPLIYPVLLSQYLRPPPHGPTSQTSNMPGL